MPGSDAAKVVLLGEVLKLRWRGPTPERLRCPRGPISSSVTSRVSSTCFASNAPNAHGRKANMMKWKEQLNGDCPKRDAPSLHERCDLVCPDLPKVL